MPGSSAAPGRRRGRGAGPPHSIIVHASAAGHRAAALPGQAGVPGHDLAGLPGVTEAEDFAGSAPAHALVPSPWIHRAKTGSLPPRRMNSYTSS